MGASELRGVLHGGGGRERSQVRVLVFELRVELAIQSPLPNLPGG